MSTSVSTDRFIRDRLHVVRFIAISASAILLGACGGGGGGGSGSSSNGGGGGASASSPAAAAPPIAAPTTVPVSGAALSTINDLAVAPGDVAGNALLLDASVAVSPVIVSQPESIVVNGGQAATFTVTASGSAAMTYQWTRGGTAIPGATSAVYGIPSVQLSDSGASFAVTVSNPSGTSTSSVARLTVNALFSISQATAARLFSDQSPWNSRPSRFALGTFQIPTSSYYPSVESGTWSVGAAVASPSDPAVTVKGPDSSTGIWIPDAESSTSQVVIPHWPAGVIPAAGADGHADIIDVAANKIHSFWQLQQVSGQWRATQYTWTALDGRGWGTPAAYMQGSRAAGVPTIGGIIRTHELDDGLPAYKHALAMSLTFNGLSASPAYVFPATSADWDAAANTGAVPEGALLMLPADFDMSKITDPRLIKIVQTLKSFGGYVVDRNYGTPFVIYVENGSNFNLMPNGWDNSIAAQLDYIRTGLRQVTQVTEWVDAKGLVFTPERNLNLLSMRGSWSLIQGTTAGVFDTWEQAVIFPENGIVTSQANNGGRSMPSILASSPQAGRLYKMSVKATGGASIRLELKSSTPQFNSGTLSDGAELVFQWPAVQVSSHVTVTSGPLGGGKVTATVTAVVNQ